MVVHNRELRFKWRGFVTDTRNDHQNNRIEVITSYYASELEIFVKTHTS